MALPPVVQDAALANAPQIIHEAGKTVRLGFKVLAAMVMRSVELEVRKEEFYEQYTLTMQKMYERAGERRSNVKELRAILKSLRKQQTKTLDRLYETVDPEKKITLEAQYKNISEQILMYYQKLEDFSKDEPSLNHQNTDHIHN